MILSDIFSNGATEKSSLSLKNKQKILFFFAGNSFATAAKGTIPSKGFALKPDAIPKLLAYSTNVTVSTVLEQK